MFRHLYLAFPLAVILLGFEWMATSGSFVLTEPEHLGQFYDAQADAFMRGRWDVPRQAIFPEEYIHDGKYYGYYGFAPALPRIALNWAFPQMKGAWSRISVCTACVFTLGFSYQLILLVRAWSARPVKLTRAEQTACSGVLILIGLGSTTLYLGGKPFLYHEAIIWAVALSLGFYAQLLGYLMDGRLWRLLLAGTLAFLCFFCRISTGSGPFLALVLLGFNIVAFNLAARKPAPDWLSRLSKMGNQWRRPPAMAHAAVAWSAAVAILAMFLWTNHAKFGTWFEAAPMRMYQYVRENPAAARESQGQWMRLGNVPTTAYAYFWPGNVTWKTSFPWIYLKTEMKTFAGSRMGGCGCYASLPVTLPALMLLSVMGVVAISKLARSCTGQGATVILRYSEGSTPFAARPRSFGVPQDDRETVVAHNDPGQSGRGEETVPATIVHPSGEPRPGLPVLVFIAALMQAALILAFFNVDHRYLQEFLPLMVLLAAFGIHLLLDLRSRGARLLLTGILLVGGVFEVYANIAFALEYQRIFVFDKAREPWLEMRRWQADVDGLVRSVFPSGQGGK